MFSTTLDTMNIDSTKLDQLAAKLKDALPQGYSDFKTLSEDKVKMILAGTLQSMDLVSRDEYDIQTQVLQRTRERLEQLEQRLSLLEEK